MSLIFAEGFEHIHPGLADTRSESYRETAKLVLPRGGCVSPKIAFGLFSASNAERMSPLQYVPASDFKPSTTSFDFFSVSGVDTTISPPVEHARKGGKALFCLIPNMWDNSFVGLVLRVKKSRTLHVGFALRQRNSFSSATPKCVTVSFGRSQQRYSCPALMMDNPPDRTNARWVMTPTGGCEIIMNSGYADCKWSFFGQTAKFSQLYHNRNLANGDWHYFEAGTTLYGNQTDNPQAWGEVRISGTPSRVENLYTAVPGSQHDSYFDTIFIKLRGYYSYSIDDIYVTNDEGTVNTGFLGSIFVRRMSPVHQGALSESVSVGAEYRHDAVGPAYVGNPTALPNPLPTSEEDPNFTAWGDPGENHLILPKTGVRQTFKCSHVNFAGSSPRIFGVVGDVLTNAVQENIGRGVLTPVRTVGGEHREHAVSMDLLDYRGRLHQLVYENPGAQETINPYHTEWGHTALNNAEYGFKLTEPADLHAVEGAWSPAILRYPAIHDVSALDGLTVGDWASRHMEEHCADGLSVADSPSQGWACLIFESMQVDDGETKMVRTVPVFSHSNVRAVDVLVIPEEFLRDGIDISISTQVDAVIALDDSLHMLDTSYHWWVEELHEFIDPLDFTDRAWTVLAADDVAVAVSDVWDGHFDVDDFVEATAFIRSNHELLEETVYPTAWTQHGIILYAADALAMDDDHHNGHWVEQVAEAPGLEAGTLTRHWRFELFYGVCTRWEDIEPLEQPLTIGEVNPCTAINNRWHEWYLQWVEEERAWLEGQL